jgi:hypothetical protein
MIKLAVMYVKDVLAAEGALVKLEKVESVSSIKSNGPGLMIVHVNVDAADTLNNWIDDIVTAMKQLDRDFLWGVRGAFICSPGIDCLDCATLNTTDLVDQRARAAASLQRIESELEARRLKNMDLLITKFIKGLSTSDTGVGLTEDELRPFRNKAERSLRQLIEEKRSQAKKAGI